MNGLAGEAALQFRAGAQACASGFDHPASLYEPAGLAPFPWLPHSYRQTELSQPARPSSDLTAEKAAE